ncbi:hypothetical protein ACIRU3_25795 [Streptomyces sp. NPDC101151]|uniref:hypothetical protein n=1 Tax=Streptomyces sp. NPDC101151 TaxID=3366115 RepID=UPI003800BF02
MRAAPIRFEVHDGVVTLSGRLYDTVPVPLDVRPARAAAGVAGARCAPAGPLRHPDLDPELRDAERARTP